MFLRFDTARSVGIFHAAYDLLKLGALHEDERDALREYLDWYEVELPVPPWDSFRSGQAVCWFREDAGRMIQNLWPVAAVLREHGVPVRVKRTWKPGRVRYSDRWQVVALPVMKTGRRS